MGLDQMDECVPGHHRLHFRQELHPLGLLLGGSLLVEKEAELPDAHQSSPGLQSHCHSSANGLAFPGSP